MFINLNVGNKRNVGQKQMLFHFEEKQVSNNKT